MTKCEFTRREIDELFEGLTSALMRTKLPTENGGLRMVPSDEFMLMHTQDNKVAGFKHSFTRNYVFLMLADSSVDGVLMKQNDLYIPMKIDEPFMRGMFDGNDEIPPRPMEPS